MRAGLARVVVNGLGAEEFVAATPAADAADILYVGELRAAKGVDTLIEALALVARETGRAPTAALIGSGPDRDALIAHAARLGLEQAVALPRADAGRRRRSRSGASWSAPSRARIHALHRA